MVFKVIITITICLSPMQSLQGSKLWGVIMKNGYDSSGPYHNNVMTFIDAQLNRLKLQGGSGSSWEYNSDDGWGLLFYSNKNPLILLENQIFRGVEPAWNSWNYNNAQDSILYAINDEIANLALGHVRRATTGSQGIPNPHPFIWNGEDGRDYSFAHNGTIEKEIVRDLILGIDPNWLNEHPPQTFEGYITSSGNACGSDWEDESSTGGWQCVVDSEIYFSWLMLHIAINDYDVLSGINQALSNPNFFQGSGDKNFIFSDGEQLYGFRRIDNNNTNHPLVYTVAFPESQDFKGAYKSIMTISSDPYSWQNDMDDHSFVILHPIQDVILLENFDTITGIESKTLNKGWNWIGFPRLLDNDSTSSELVLETLVPFVEEVRYTESGIMAWDPIDSTWDNNGLGNFNSTRGYKMKMSDSASAYLLPVQGEVGDSGTPITLEDGENWINYFLPTAQSPLDALPQEVKNHLTLLKGQHWFMAVEDGEFLPYMGCGSEDPEDCSLKMEYGNTYLLDIELDIEDEITFTWNTPNETSETEPSEITYTPHFTYEEKEYYQPVIIESIENGANIIELGAFKDGKCVGSERVEGCPINLKLYAKIEDIPNLTYDVITQNLRGRTTTNQNGFSMVKQIPVTSHVRRENGTAFVTLKMVDEKKKNDHSPNAFSYVQTAPNPFNLKTTIQFGLEKDTWLSLSIFDIRGRKIASLAEGNFQKGSYAIDWNGKNHWGDSVSSGMYFYHLNGIREHKKGKLLLLK